FECGILQRCLLAVVDLRLFGFEPRPQQFFITFDLRQLSEQTGHQRSAAFEPANVFIRIESTGLPTYLADTFLVALDLVFPAIDCRTQPTLKVKDSLVIKCIALSQV